VTQSNAELMAVIEPYVGTLSDWILSRGGDIVQGVLQVTIALFVAFFLYRDGHHMSTMVHRLVARMAGHRSAALIATARDTIDGVVRGVLGTSLVQAILMGLTLSIAGIPAAMLLGFLAFVLSLVPMGLIVIWLPAAIWLASHDSMGWAIFMAAAGLFVGTVDNWLRPLLILSKSELPLVPILLGVLGGALMFGFLGIVLGPALLAVGLSLLREWASEPVE
jgi:predicted PurR-regulated permease PerM